MHTLETQNDSIFKSLLTGLRFSVLMLVLCGVGYAPLTTLGAKWLFPAQAMGSLIVINGDVRGSALVGQSFVSAGYFHGRPSAANYDPMAAAGSNFAPDNPALRQRVAQDSVRLQQQEQVSASQIPVDLLAASGSGLDPHISPAAAQLQIPRISIIRGIDEAKLSTLVNQHTEGKQFGILGQPRVNVLQLNRALDQMQAVVRP